MVQRIDWQSWEDRRGLTDQLVRALVEGNLVVFPTETVYGLASYALDSSAVDRLIEVKGRASRKPLTLALAFPNQAHAYVPAMPTVGRRLVDRCWPGPLTIVFPADNGGALDRLPDSVRQWVAPSGYVGLRVPDHPAIQAVLQSLPGPVVLTSANRSGEADPVDGDAAVRSLGDWVEIVVDDGPTRFRLPSTVVRVDESGLELLREGILPLNRVRRMAGEVITFVCTGNSCRSPMAEALCKRMLADRLGCEPDELPDHGFTITSAGLAAFDGGPASSGAREAVRAYNTSLDDHVSQSLTEELVRISDRLLVMTQEHQRTIESLWPQIGPPPKRLCGQTDIADPMGGSFEEYRGCARQIAESLAQLLDEVQPRPRSRPSR
jgi:protein-tyrosine phosphatase